MGKEIGKIVRGESHILYWVQVQNEIESGGDISPDDSAYGSFVFIEKSRKTQQGIMKRMIVGIISDTMLVDRDALRNGPRLSQNMDDMKLMYPDFIDERIKVVKILIIGQIVDGESVHHFPRISPNLGDSVITMSRDEIKDFHYIHGKFQIGYYSAVVETSIYLMRQVLGQLKPIFQRQKPVFQLLINNLEYLLKMKGGGF